MGPRFGCERSGATFLKSTGVFAAFFIFGREIACTAMMVPF